MLLAAITDYFFPWHLLVILAYMVIWLAGGHFLTLKALARFPDLPRQKRSPQTAFALNVVATGLGLLGALVMMGFFAAVARSLEKWQLGFYGAAVLLAPVAALLLSWAATMAMLNLPSKALWGIVLRTTGVLMLAGAVMVAAAAYPTFGQRQNKKHLGECKVSMAELALIMDNYVKANPGKVPANLGVLVAGGMDERFTHCGGVTTGAKLVYLAPPKFGQNIDKTDAERIVACDPAGAHGGRRVVMLASGDVQDMAEVSFQRLLEKPENQAFAKLLAGK